MFKQTLAATLWLLVLAALAQGPVRDYLAQDAYRTSRVDLMARPATVNEDGIFGTADAHVAIRHVGSSDKTYYCWVNSSGDIMVGSFDHDAKTTASFTLSSSFEADSHAAPTLRIRADGKIQVFWTGHNQSLVRWRISTNAEDISAWGTEQSSAFGIGTPTLTYPQVVEMSAGPVLHFRDGNAINGDQHYTESTDDGASWANSVNMIQIGESAYIKAVAHPSANRIDYMLASGNSNEAAVSIYHFYREDDDFYKSDGTKVSTGTGSLPLATADMTLVYDGSSVDGSRVDLAHDGSGNPVILYATIPGSTGYELYHAAWNGSSWSTNKVDDFGDAIWGRAHGGGALDPEDETKLWACVVSDALVSQLRLYETSDGGSTWSHTNISDDAQLHYNPAVPLNASPDLQVMWTRGRFEASNSYEQQVMGYGSAPPTGAGSLSQTTDGELYTGVAGSADHAFNVNDWEAQSQTSALAVDSNGILAHDGSSSNFRYVRCSASPNRNTRMVQVLQYMDGSGQIFTFHGAHFEAGAGGDQAIAHQWTIDHNTSERVILRLRSGQGGSDLDFVVGLADKNKRSPYRSSLFVDGFDSECYDFHSDTSLSDSSQSTYDEGYAGVGGWNTHDAYVLEVFDCAGKTLTCTGLSTGDKLQLRNVLGVVLKEATESGGTATIDMTEVEIPEVNDLVVVDSGGSLLGGLTLAGSGGPKEYARGGDEYSFTAGDTPPSTPTVTVTSVSATGVSAETSAFSAGSGGGSHEATQWRITRLSDDTVVYNPGDDTSNLTSIVNAGSTVPLDTESEVYTLEARHGEST